MKAIKKSVSILLLLSYSSLVFAENTSVASPAPEPVIPSSDSTVTPQPAEPATQPPQAPVAPPSAGTAVQAPGAYKSSYNDCIKSKIAGRSDAAQNHGTIGWGAFGIISGFLFGLIGVGASTLISIIPSPDPQQEPDLQQAPDLQCYSEAYSKKARSKNIVTTLGTSTIGWIISIPVVIALKK